MGSRARTTATGPRSGRALDGANAQGKRDSESLGEELLFTATPILQDGRTAGAVRATQSVAAVEDEVRGDALVLVGAGGAALLLGIAVAWVLAGFLTRPLDELAGTARRVAKGDLSARAAVTGSREHREVATSFNEMTSRLQSALEAQREFVANASHQLRTPLTGLRLRLEAAGDRSRDPQVHEELRAAEDQVERLAGLLGNLLVLAREGQERPDPEAVDLGRCSRIARDRWEAEAASLGRRISVDGPDDVRVLASPDDIGIVLDNLIENALEVRAERKRHARVGAARRAWLRRCQRRGHRPRAGRARAGAGAVHPRAIRGGQPRHGAGPCDRGRARRALGRRGKAGQPRAARVARRGLVSLCRFFTRGSLPSAGMRRPAVAICVLAVLGLVAAAGIGLLVNKVSGDSIGLAAQPLSAGSLAPPAAADAKDRGRGRGSRPRTEPR